MKKLLLAIFVLALFTSTLLVQIFVPQASAIVPPQNTLPNYRLYSDGGGSTPSIQWDGAKFTLTQDIEGTITIESSGVELDGAGFTVKGRGTSNGIALYDKNNITIRNVNVENFGNGILLGHYSPDAFLWYDPNPNRATNCTVSNCQVLNNTHGIAIIGGIKCRIIGNQATNNIEGIMFYGSENVFRNNHMKNNSISFVDTYAGNYVDSSNTINDRPIYYLVNQQNMTVPADASMVHLEGCSNIEIKYLDIRFAYKAISVFNSSDCKIYGNTITGNEIGISFRNSTNNSIIHNELFNNTNDAIEQYDSKNTVVANNLIRANGGGIDSAGYSAAGSPNAVISSNQIISNGGCGIQASAGCTITGNFIEGNGQHGIYFWNVSNSVIYRNNITQNGDCGICFRIGRNAMIFENDISKNNLGMGMGDSTTPISACTIKENNFSQNRNLCIRIDGDVEGNSFYRNNFLNNNNDSVQVTIKGGFVYRGDVGYNESAHDFPQYYSKHNAWDNGTVGNYWSDYDPTADGATYRIAENNQDNYPQTAALQMAQLEMPTAGLEAPQPGVPSGVQLGGIQLDDQGGVASVAVVIVATAVAIATVVLLYWRRLRKSKLLVV